MTMRLLHQIYAGTAPWLALSLLFLGWNPRLSRLRIAGSLLMALFLLRIPVEGWPVSHWIAMLEPNPSFILTALLGIALWERVGGRHLLRPSDWRAAWIFGSIASLALYPTGLGLTAFDANTWGWRPALPLAAASATALLLLRGNRFGILLLLPPLGFLLQLQESRNFWDALIDPFYGGFSLIAVTVSMFRKKGAKNAGAPSGSGV